MSLPDLGLSQTNLLNLLNKIKGAYNNYIRQYKDDMDLGSIESRITQLDINWRKYQARHQETPALKNDDNKTYHYFSSPNQALDLVEECYVMENCYSVSLTYHYNI